MGVVWCITFLCCFYVGFGETVNTCMYQKSCADCIQDPSVCVWCAMDNFNDTRCKPVSTLKENWCGKFIENPKNYVNSPIEDNIDFNFNPGKVTQIKPQKYNLELRPGMLSEFSFDYKAASDYPIDLYFLLDASNTMSDVRDEVLNQSTKIYETMNKLSKDVYFGMGSFVDKNTFPFTKEINSQNTYSLKNRLKLNGNITEFIRAVRSATFGSNHDEPEGGLDALAQVMACTPEIGWRNESRKIVIFLTNSPSHSAGDGILGGIVQPYNGECYMDENGTYTRELEMDYPTTSLLNKISSDRRISVIFIVSEAEYSYSRISNKISGSYSIQSNGEEIHSILKNIYEKITKNIKLKVNMHHDQRNNFRIAFDPDCYSNNATNNIACSVKKDEEKHFKGTITLLNYNGVVNTSVYVTIEGVVEKLTLNVKIIKDCECETRSIAKSEACNKAGTLECGICKCDTDRSGETCACIVNSNTPNVNENSTCINIAQGDTELCSGHGTCICGKCMCRRDSPYDGKYCQFNKNNCPRYNNAVCNGNGPCEEGKCICNSPVWTGDACECLMLDTPCTQNSKVCNGIDRGRCSCGICKCKPTAAWDARENQDSFCNILPCPDCHEPQCNVLTPCALCLHSGATTCSECAQFNTKTTSYSISTLNNTWNICPNIRVDAGCYTNFMYRYEINKYNIELVVQSTANCLENYYMIGGILLATFILIGLATAVAWKWLTEVRDRREFERFLKETEDEDMETCHNPMYVAASTTINNPAYRKRSVDIR